MQPAGQTPTSLENPDAVTVASLDEIRERICRLNEKVQFNTFSNFTPSTFTDLHSAGVLDVVHPADAGEVRGQTGELIADITSSYLRADSSWRERLRALWSNESKFRFLAWDCLPYSAASSTPVDRWRVELLLWSIHHQFDDPRDSLPGLDQIILEAHKDGVDPCPLLLEVADSCEDIAPSEEPSIWDPRYWLEKQASAFDAMEHASWRAAFALVDARGELSEPFEAAHVRFRERRVCWRWGIEDTRQVLQSSVDVMRIARKFCHEQLVAPRPLPARQQELLEELAQLLLRECPHASARLRAGGCRHLKDCWTRWSCYWGPHCPALPVRQAQVPPAEQSGRRLKA